VIPNRAQGYAFAGGTHWNDRFLSMSQPGAAGVLISTAGDLVRWQRALVTGQVLSPESYLEMTTPFLLNDGRETAYGMGVQLDAVAGEPCVWHGGGIHGFNSVLLHFPRVDLSIAVDLEQRGAARRPARHGARGGAAGEEVSPARRDWPARCRQSRSAGGIGRAQKPPRPNGTAISVRGSVAPVRRGRTSTASGTLVAAEPSAPITVSVTS
jgi:hypothetical protein